MKKYFEVRPGMSHEEKQRLIGEAYTVGYKFARKIFEKFPGIIKSVVLFGSMAKMTPTRSSDIDILVIFDDTVLMPTANFVEWYNTEIIQAIQKIDRRLHVNTVTLTAFWDNVRTGEPVAINVLRYGVSLIDTGFFEPLQMLLRKGKIRPTEEAIWNALTRVPGHLVRANARVLAGVTDFYWAMVDSAHAALMSYGKVPPSPEHIPELLKETFVKSKKIPKKFLDYYNEIWKTAKGIVHGEILKVSGIDYDRFREMTEEFQRRMKELVEEKEREKA